MVVSPLIALMSDQWHRLERAGVRATMLASGMADGHNEQALRDIESGVAQLVLAAPERFASGAFRAALARRRVALFVVDEAHCVAEWGHDFRPDYLRLHDAITSLRGGPDGGRPAVMAATATATPQVAQEIAARLGLRDWLSIRSGFDRPNLTFDVVSVEGKGAVARKRAALMHALTAGASGDAAPATLPAIVYCGTRKDTDEVAASIAQAGIDTVTYHAGMGPQARRDSQAAFMQGSAQVVVATNAFGMGVDKADVRTVAHWALPTSLEAYYQDAGRGGRDGAPGRALLLASRMDLGRLIRFIKERDMSVEDVKRYVAGLRNLADGHDQLTIGHGELGERQRVLLSVAERAGAVELQPGGRDGLLVALTGRGSPRDSRTLRSRPRAAAAGRHTARSSATARTDRPAAGARSSSTSATPPPVHPAGAAATSATPTPRSSGRCSRHPPTRASGLAQVAAPRRARACRRVRQAISSPSTSAPSRSCAPGGWRRAEGKPAFTVASDATLARCCASDRVVLARCSRSRGSGPRSARSTASRCSRCSREWTPDRHRRAPPLRRQRAPHWPKGCVGL